MQQHNVEFVYIKYKIYLEYLPHSVVQFSGHLLCPMCSEKAVVFISGVHAAFSSWEILLLYYFLLSLKHLSHTVMGSAALDLWHDFSRLWPWSGCRWVVLKSSCSVSSLAVCHVVCQVWLFGSTHRLFAADFQLQDQLCYGVAVGTQCGRTTGDELLILWMIEATPYLCRMSFLQMWSKWVTPLIHRSIFVFIVLRQCSVSFVVGQHSAP